MMRFITKQKNHIEHYDPTHSAAQKLSDRPAINQGQTSLRRAVNEEGGE
jgi:hypothetical protein